MCQVHQMQARAAEIRLQFCQVHTAEECLNAKYTHLKLFALPQILFWWVQLVPWIRKFAKDCIFWHLLLFACSTCWPAQSSWEG